MNTDNPILNMPDKLMEGDLPDDLRQAVNILYREYGRLRTYLGQLLMTYRSQELTVDAANIAMQQQLSTVAAALAQYTEVSNKLAKLTEKVNQQGLMLNTIVETLTEDE